MQNWVKASIGLAVFSFINLLLFIVFSGPFELLLGTLGTEATHMNVSSSVTPIYNNIRTVFGLTFALSAIGAIVWFILGSHQDEFEQM
jgi:hypothetical protein